MTYQRRDPLLGHNFSVSLLDTKDEDDKGFGLGTIALSTAGLRTMASFSEITGLEVAMDVEEYSSGGINDTVLKFPGRNKPANLVMKRGVLAKRDPTDESDLWTWVEKFLDGEGVRKDGIVVLHDGQGKPQLTWSFRRALPLRWTGPSLDAGRSAVAIESIELAHEGVRLVRSGGVLGQAINTVVDAIF